VLADGLQGDVRERTCERAQVSADAGGKPGQLTCFDVPDGTERADAAGLAYAPTGAAGSLLITLERLVEGRRLGAWTEASTAAA
jgi:hypothetical protein